MIARGAMHHHHNANARRPSRAAARPLVAYTAGSPVRYSADVYTAGTPDMAAYRKENDQLRHRLRAYEQLVGSAASSHGRLPYLSKPARDDGGNTPQHNGFSTGAVPQPYATPGYSESAAAAVVASAFDDAPVADGTPRSTPSSDAGRFGGGGGGNRFSVPPSSYRVGSGATLRSPTDRSSLGGDSSNNSGIVGGHSAAAVALLRGATSSGSTSVSSIASASSVSSAAPGSIRSLAGALEARDNDVAALSLARSAAVSLLADVTAESAAQQEVIARLLTRLAHYEAVPEHLLPGGLGRRVVVAPAADELHRGRETDSHVGRREVIVAPAAAAEEHGRDSERVTGGQRERVSERGYGVRAAGAASSDAARDVTVSPNQLHQHHQLHQQPRDFTVLEEGEQQQQQHPRQRQGEDGVSTSPLRARSNFIAMGDERGISDGDDGTRAAEMRVVRGTVSGSNRAVTWAHGSHNGHGSDMRSSNGTRGWSEHLAQQQQQQQGDLFISRIHGSSVATSISAATGSAATGSHSQPAAAELSSIEAAAAAPSLVSGTSTST